ncbi:MAG TPA: hypothetical protein DFS52_30350, partial [Myxococcales bacterium]|nr:hypothetical protein [Myxococcales bacterium]
MSGRRSSTSGSGSRSAASTTSSPGSVRCRASRPPSDLPDCWAQARFLAGLACAPRILRVRFFLFFLVLLLGLPARAAETVRIAIVDGATQITLAGKDLEVRHLEVGERYAPAPGGRSVVYLAKGEMMLDGAPVRAVDGVKYRSQGFVRVADKPVRGEIEVRPNGKGKLIAINVIPLEDYLAAVLGSEMPASFPP